MAKIPAVKGVKYSFKKLAFNCFMRTVLATVIGFIIYISFNALAVGFFTEDIGYTVKYSEDGSEYKDVYTYYYEEGEDTRLQQYISDTEESNYYKQSIRSTLTKGQTLAVRWVSQVAVFIIWVSMIYSVMWAAGDADATKQDFGGKKYSKSRGFKIGLAAGSPFIAAYVFLLINQIFDLFKIYPTIYKIITWFAFALNDTFLTAVDGKLVFTFSGAVVLSLAVVALPVLAGLSYLTGGKHIVVKEKIIYENKK